MNNTPFILLKDPHSHVVNHDTGFGNRLHCWNILSILNSSSELPIITRLHEFPELKHLDIPNLSLDYPKVNKPYNFLLYPTQKIQNYKNITSSHLLEYKNTGNLKLNKNHNWVTEYSWEEIDKLRFSPHYNTTTYFPQISLKSKELQNEIIDFSKNLISIHVRRGGGVLTSPGDLRNIPPKSHEYFSLNSSSTGYEFFSEDQLINIIEGFISHTPNSKIYLSLDLSPKTVSHIKIRYGKDRILTSDSFTLKNKKLLNKLDFLSPILDFDSIGNNLIDFFILAYSKFSIHSLYSTWGETGKFITQKPFILNKNYDTDNIYQPPYSVEDIIKKYNELSSK